MFKPWQKEELIHPQKCDEAYRLVHEIVYFPEIESFKRPLKRVLESF